MDEKHVFLMRHAFAAIACTILIASSSQACASGPYSTGDTWLYTVTSTYQQTMMVGHWEIRYAGVTTRTVDNHSYRVYDFESDMSLNISGSIEGMPVWGNSWTIESRYLEVNTLDTIVYEYNASLHYVMEVPYPVDHFYYHVRQEFNSWIHNTSTYSPPGGIGSEPSVVDIGVNWTKTYNESYKVMEWYGNSVVSHSANRTENVFFSLIRRENITVPAGTFDCLVLRQVTSDDTTTRWISKDVGHDVKIVTVDNSSETTTAVLTSYTHEPPNGDDAFAYLLVAAGVGVTTAAVVTILAFRTRRGIRIS